MKSALLLALCAVVAVARSTPNGQQAPLEADTKTIVSPDGSVSMVQTEAAAMSAAQMRIKAALKGRVAVSANGKTYLNKDRFISSCAKYLGGSMKNLSLEDQKTMVGIQLKSMNIKLDEKQTEAFDKLMSESRDDPLKMCQNAFKTMTVTGAPALDAAADAPRV